MKESWKDCAEYRIVEDGNGKFSVYEKRWRYTSGWVSLKQAKDDIKESKEIDNRNKLSEEKLSVWDDDGNLVWRGDGNFEGNS